MSESLKDKRLRLLWRIHGDLRTVRDIGDLNFSEKIIDLRDKVVDLIESIGGLPNES